MNDHKPPPDYAQDEYEERDAGDFLFGVIWGIALSSVVWTGIALMLGVPRVFGWSA